MSNTRKAKPRKEPDVSARIAEATGEDAADVKAAIASLVADGIPFDEVWDVHLHAALNEFANDADHGVVDYCARILGEREHERDPVHKAAEGFVAAIEAQIAQMSEVERRKN